MNASKIRPKKNGKQPIAPTGSGAIKAPPPAGYIYLEPLPGHKTWDGRLSHHCTWLNGGRLLVREYKYGSRV